MDRHESAVERRGLFHSLARTVKNIGRTTIGLDPAIVEALESNEGLKFGGIPDTELSIPLDIYRRRKPEKTQQYPNLIRVTFNGQAELMDEVMKASLQYGISLTTFINQALSTELFISEKRELGKKIFYEESPGNFRKMVWTKDSK